MKMLNYGIAGDKLSEEEVDDLISEVVRHEQTIRSLEARNQALVETLNYVTSVTNQLPK